MKEEVPPRIRWRKGDMIGCGAFGQVFRGMNLDSGELLAVKQVWIGTSNASEEEAQDRIRELEEEVKLLKNLSHPNIVGYLGTVREGNTLNILSEFVASRSISSLLRKCGSFPEAVIRMYTKQLLQGLDYLHQNKIIHRDIKGANIFLGDNGCIKLADFGASKQVLATMTAAKSMKGTPYWLAPEVIVQTGHSFSADIWSVGCTVIEMATGKPPWSSQFQEVAALFHAGTTKSHPPIPEHLSSEAKDFLLKCLQEEPGLRPTASDLLQHPFVTGELEDVHQLNRAGSKRTGPRGAYAFMEIIRIAENISNYSDANATNASKLPPTTPSKISSSALPTMLLPSGSSRNVRPSRIFSQHSSRCSVEGTHLQGITSPQKLNQEPGLRTRPTASDLLQHPFVTGQLEDVHQLNRAGCKRTGPRGAYSFMEIIQIAENCTEGRKLY